MSNDERPRYLTQLRAYLSQTSSIGHGPDVHPCREMETRTCPPAGPCIGPCARFESDDPAPWMR